MNRHSHKTGQSEKTKFGILFLACTLLAGFCHPDGVAQAALTDEIEVYDAGINENDFVPLDRQDQTLFAVVDYKKEPNSVEFGAAHSFTDGGEGLVFKLILAHNF
ncbi:MAG: hypothetical protein ABSG91_02550 [Syntrophobacteraceae bacterium]